MTMSLSTTAGHTREYSLSDDLARLCLPQEYADSNRTLAWVNSICFLFLVVGLIGLKPPTVVIKAVSEPVEIVPVVFTPPEEPPQTQPQPESDEPPPSAEAVVDTPVVATVAAADPASVAFAVPVKGPVTVVPARYAAPPPANQPEPPKPTRFDPNAAPGGAFPDPPYPREELLARHQGQLTLSVIVEADGTASSVTVKDSSGYPGLDRHAAQWVKTRWRWLPGSVRYYYMPFVFRLQ
jgi:TonB family protein